MENRFIWDIDQDTIHFVSSFDFEEPLEYNYITGDYLAPEQSIVLYTDNVNIPINLDYFVRLWKSSEPDKPLKRDRVELMQKQNNLKESKVKFSKNEKKIIDLFLNGTSPDVSKTNIANFLYQNPSLEEVKRFFTPTILQYNNKILDHFYPANFPQTPDEWKNLSEEEVFRYVEQFTNHLPLNYNNQQETINQLMDRWHQTGVPVDANDYTIDESLVDWSGLLNQLSRMIRTSKWNKKSEHQGMTNWETWNVDVIMENDYELSQFFYNMIANNASVENFAIEGIKRVVGPYNKDLLDQFEAISDEEEVRMKMESDLEKWRYNAERHFPDDLNAQEKYINQLREIVYGLMGEPEPTDISNHWIDESKVNWQEIYDKWKSNWAEQRYKKSKWKKQ